MNHQPLTNPQVHPLLPQNPGHGPFTNDPVHGLLPRNNNMIHPKLTTSPDHRVPERTVGHPLLLPLHPRTPIHCKPTEIPVHGPRHHTTMHQKFSKSLDRWGTRTSPNANRRTSPDKPINRTHRCAPFEHGPSTAPKQPPFHKPGSATIIHKPSGPRTTTPKAHSQPGSWRRRRRLRQSGLLTAAAAACCQPVSSAVQPEEVEEASYRSWWSDHGQ